MSSRKRKPNWSTAALVLIGLLVVAAPVSAKPGSGKSSGKNQRIEKLEPETKDMGAVAFREAVTEVRDLARVKRLTGPAEDRAMALVRMDRIEGAALDFRDEIMAQIYDRGDPRPKRALTFNIEVTDHGETHGPPFRERRTFRNWRRIGTITFDRAVVSYNGDFVIHFRHPTWRDDQNNPATDTRVNGRKVR